MAKHPGLPPDRRARRSWVLLVFAAPSLVATLSSAGWIDEAESSRNATDHPTIAPGPDITGSIPTALAMEDRPPAESRLAAHRAPDRVEVPRRTAAPAAAPNKPTAEADPITFAKQAIADCRTRFDQVQDYTCTFFKRERLDDGRLSAQHAMTMKARTKPASIYFKFQRPTPGREAIYVAGHNGNRVLAHDVGLGKFLAGTLALDPTGSRAMADNRHPVTEAGIGHMIDTISERWAAEMRAGETRVVIDPNVQINHRPCTMIESTHPQREPGFLFHSVKVYIDRELGLPIRFEAYDWPERPGGRAGLVEEYTYLNLKLNVGLKDHDFDPANKSYSFGRF